MDSKNELEHLFDLPVNPDGGLSGVVDPDAVFTVELTGEQVNYLFNALGSLAGNIEALLFSVNFGIVLGAAVLIFLVFWQVFRIAFGR